MALAVEMLNIEYFRTHSTCCIALVKSMVQSLCCQLKFPLAMPTSQQNENQLSIWSELLGTARTENWVTDWLCTFYHLVHQQWPEVHLQTWYVVVTTVTAWQQYINYNISPCDANCVWAAVVVTGIRIIKTPFVIVQLSKHFSHSNTVRTKHVWISEFILYSLFSGFLYPLFLNFG